MKIWLVEDDDDDLMLLTAAIKEASPLADVVNFTSSQSFLKILGTLVQDKPNIVFVASNLSGINGRQCLSKVRSMQEYAVSYVVMMSTYMSDNDVRETFSNGANRYIIKPNSYQQLLTIVSTIVTDCINLPMQLAGINNYVIS